MPERAAEAGRQFGPYRLVQQIATGGMAEIRLATTKGFEGFEKLVALKMIHPNFSSDDHFVQMLIDEAKISVQLQHVNIAHVFDLGKVGDTYYIAMEYVDGCDLFKVLRKASELDRYMPLETACYIAKEVCAGLDYAHHKRDSAGVPMGIVHRDVSPQNVLLSHAGEVKIVDFGIAKATMRARQTAVGVIKGKYYYMSPEQAWGDPVDHRTDIFSAGILLYEMLTGQMLYLEEDMHKLLDLVRKANIPPPSTKRTEVPRELDRIVMRALSKKPDVRWQSAQDFGTAIERFLHGFAPDFSAQRLAAFVNEVMPPAPPPVPPPEKRQDATARVARQSIMQSRSEFSDENSVIYRLGQRPVSPEPNDEEILRGKPPPPRISPNRLTTPAASLPAMGKTGARGVSPNRLTPPSASAPPVLPSHPASMASSPVSSPRAIAAPSPAPVSVSVSVSVPVPATAKVMATKTETQPTIDESQVPKTIVSAPPGFEGDDGGTIELSADMLEPVDDPADALASPTLKDPEPPRHDEPTPAPELTPAIVLTPSPELTPAPELTSDIATEVAAPKPAAPVVSKSAPPVVAAAKSTPPRRTRRTPGSGVPVPAAPRISESAPRAAASNLPLPPNEESGPLLVPPPPASASTVWPPQPAAQDWAEDDFFGIRIGGRFHKRNLLAAAGVIAVTVGLGALAVAAFSGAPAGREDATLEVISVPEKAHVFADGRDMGTSPVKIEHLAVGKPVSIRLERDEYQPWQRTLTPSEPSDLKMAASLKPILGTLRVDSTPEGAEVFFDNRSLGATPLIRSDMNPFVDGTVEVRKEGHRPSRQGLRWDGQRQATLKFELQPTTN